MELIVHGCQRDFNPRSHEGSDIIPGHSGHNRFNFNPRSHEGSDKTAAQRISSCSKFQSTLPRGERHNCENVDICLQTISIHAPTRGATSGSFLTSRSLYFNPRSHEGSDHRYLVTGSPLAEFQSTLPRGERQMGNFIPYLISKFQSTLPRGERPLLKTHDPN